MSVKRDIAVTATSWAVFGLFAYLLYRKMEAEGSFDPTNPDNLAYKAVNSIGVSLTGNKDFAFGSWLYEATHPGEPDLTAPTTPGQRQPVEVPLGTRVYEWLHPDEPDLTAPTGRTLKDINPRG